jgi:hypothetical protein
VKVPPITFAFSGGVLRDAIGIALIAAFIGALIALMWKDIPKPNEQLIVYMLGQLSGFVATVVGFHYVTKSGEKELDAQRAANTENALPQSAPIAGALLGFALGFVREFTQHGRIPRGAGSWLDMAFWTLGGAVAGALL